MRNIIKIIVLIVSVVLVNTIVHGQEGDEYDIEKEVGRFYRTALGTMAFIPHATTRKEAIGSTKFHVLPRSGAYNLPRQSYYWFILNHRTTDTPVETYVGIEIIPIYPERIVPRAEVSLGRNQGWVRLNDQNFEGEADVYSIFENRSIIDFLYFHRENAELSSMDQMFGFKWHGMTIETNKNSWDKRKLWQPTVEIRSDQFRSNFSSEKISKNFRIMLNGQLIRFKTTNRVKSHNPVVFGFNGRDPIAAYIKIFCHDSSDFDGEYYLTFK